MSDDIWVDADTEAGHVSDIINGVVVAGDLTTLIVASKNRLSPLRTHNVAELNRSLFTIGLISNHFDFADIVPEMDRVCVSQLCLYEYEYAACILYVIRCGRNSCKSQVCLMYSNYQLVVEIFSFV